jgi:hypothetical protein
MGQWFLERACTKEAQHFITFERKAKNSQLPFYSRHPHLYKVLRNSFEYPDWKGSVLVQGRVERKLFFTTPVIKL